MLTPCLMIGGVGTGVFILFVVGIVCLIYCFIGYQARRPTFPIIVSTLILAVLIIIFAALPKGESQETDVYDEFWSLRIGISVMLLVGAVIAALLTVVDLGTMKIKASRITPEERYVHF